MITNLRNRFNFAKILLASTFLFSTLSSITKAEDRFFYQLGASYVEGNSHSTYTRSAFASPFAGNIEGHKLDFGLGLSSEINKIKVDYILSYAPDAFGNQVDTKNSCPNTEFECRVNIKDSLNLGAKFYLPSNASKITPTIYFGVSNADIQFKTFDRTAGDPITMMSHQRNWGATAGLGLNYDLNNDTAISLDYSWTAYEKNEEQVTTVSEFAKSRVEINSLSLKLKKYF
jgi:opacity protein-like surface antigen